jgi:hypothetical protein
VAQKVLVQLLDDLDGSEAQQTRRFGWEGNDYEIDLSEKNDAALAKTIEKYVAAARRVGRSPRAKGRALVKVPTDVDASAVRAWATANGVTVNVKGRVPASVIEQYRAAGN